MATYTIGEEVLYDDERFVIAGKTEQEPVRYRLLATSAKGAKFEWVSEKDLEKIGSYHEAYDDTALYK